MNEQKFRAELKETGFECTEFSIAPNVENPEHSHPWQAKVLILEGALTLSTSGSERTYGPGETCGLDGNVLHAEHAGPAGVRGLVGKKTS